MNSITGLGPKLIPAVGMPGPSASRRVPAGADSQQELREAFTKFVGQTFFGQMIKAMRSTVGKPAYFHGGQGEEVFRSQLDQTLAEYMTEASAARFAEPMFERQFPHLVDATRDSDATTNASMEQLSQLSRR